MKMTQAPNGTFLRIMVKPRSKTFGIKPEADALIVCCRNVPEKGKVNKELIKELSKLLKRQVEVVSGFASKEKVIFVRDVKMEELEAMLRGL